MRASAPASFPILAALCALVLLASSSLADVVIYTIDFDKTGRSVNDPGFESGIIIIDTETRTFNSILILPDPTTGQPYYTTDLLTGNYLEVLEDDNSGDIFGVLAGTSGGGEEADGIGLQVTGKTSGNVGIGPGSSTRIAKKMTGVFFANQSEVFTSIDESTTVFEFGFASSYRATARFDQGSTKDANNQRLDAATTLSRITATLENRGISPEPTPTPSPTPTDSLSL